MSKSRFNKRTQKSQGSVPQQTKRRDGPCSVTRGTNPGFSSGARGKVSSRQKEERLAHSFLSFRARKPHVKPFPLTVTLAEWHEERDHVSDKEVSPKALAIQKRSEV